MTAIKPQIMQYYNSVAAAAERYNTFVT